MAHGTYGRREMNQFFERRAGVHNVFAVMAQLTSNISECQRALKVRWGVVHDAIQLCFDGRLDG